jgi:hypothetical protein
VGELFDVSANGDRFRILLNVGHIVMGLDGVERVDLGALGGAEPSRSTISRAPT